MQLKLELLAPAKNKDIGIAAIDCGADALYIAGPSFGAREAAGNSLSDIEELVQYAHTFGVRIYVVVNTILYDSELEEARKLITDCYRIGCDAIIVQDLGILKMDLPPIPLHASTQTNIRTPEQALFLESLGFQRLILARELSLEQIAAIRKVTRCELEAFVHGALCVSYSGQCYMSQAVAGRSANRGCCVQACRSSYDLLDGSGKVLVKDSPLLSLKDLSLDRHISDLADAGITTFKIEGRLKNISYVRNVTRYWRARIDELGYGKVSFGKIEGGFTPNRDATFNRGYTEFFINGRRGRWNSGTSTKSVGEYIGEVGSVLSSTQIRYRGRQISNGDGLLFLSRPGQSLGIRADVVEGDRITVKSTSGIRKNAAIYRNFNINFEKEIENNPPKRRIDVQLSILSTTESLVVRAEAEGNVTATRTLLPPFAAAKNPEIALANFSRQLGKRTDAFSFTVRDIKAPFVPFLPVSTLNAIRRELAEELSTAFRNRPRAVRQPAAGPVIPPAQRDYLNCSNRLSRQLYEEIGIVPAPAYELAPQKDFALMRTKYCIRHELGMCLKQDKGCYKGPLYLSNQKNRFKLTFDCKNCEMIIS